MRKNYFFNLSQQIITAAVGLIVTLYLSKIFSLNNYGYFVYVTAIINLCTLFSTFGLNVYGSKVYLNHKSTDPYSNILTVQLFSMSIVLIFILIMTVMMNLSIYVGLIIILNIIFITLQPLWYNIANDKITLNNKILIFSQIINLILIISFVKNNGDFKILLGILVGVNFIKFMLFKKVIPEKYSPSKKHISVLILKEYLIMFLPYICISVYISIDKIMIANLGNMDEVAVYNAGIVILKSSLIVISSIMPMLIVENTKNIKDINKSLNKMIIPGIYVSSILMSIFIITGKEVVELLFDEKYYMTSYIIIYGSIIIPLMATSFIVVGTYIIPKGRNDVFLKSTISAAICNIIFNFLLIPNFGALGGLASTIFSEFIAIIVMLFYIRNILEKINITKNIMVAVFINIIVITILSNIYFDILFLSILIKAILSIMINVLLIYLILKIRKIRIRR